MASERTNRSEDHNVVKIKLLIMVAAADKFMDERESVLIDSLAVKFGIDGEELNAIRRRPRLELQELTDGLPDNNTERIDLMGDLVRMAFADKRLDDREFDVLVRLGSVLGFDEEIVRDIVDDVQSA